MVNDRDNPRAVDVGLCDHKVCMACGRDKLLEEFNKNPKGKLGRRSDCKVCAKVKVALKEREVVKLF